jgi:hypothetical protein
LKWKMMFVDLQPAAAAKAVAAPHWAFAACALWVVGNLKGLALARTSASRAVLQHKIKCLVLE